MRYDYRCEKCKKEEEVSHGMSESPKIRCKCGKRMTKLITGGFGFQVKRSEIILRENKQVSREELMEFDPNR